MRNMEKDETSAADQQSVYGPDVWNSLPTTRFTDFLRVFRRAVCIHCPNFVLLGRAAVAGYYVDAAYCYGRSSVVCLSVGLP